MEVKRHSVHDLWIRKAHPLDADFGSPLRVDPVGGHPVDVRLPLSLTVSPLKFCPCRGFNSHAQRGTLDLLDQPSHLNLDLVPLHAYRPVIVVATIIGRLLFIVVIVVIIFIGSVGDVTIFVVAILRRCLLMVPILVILSPIVAVVGVLLIVCTREHNIIVLSGDIVAVTPVLLVFQLRLDLVHQSKLCIHIGRRNEKADAPCGGLDRVLFVIDPHNGIVAALNDQSH
mmetsp:Transcript_22140/g.54431  ORF Transcript_22140/g.54431 Transcript_22140/m.54431 type:complete len:228 (+) Transcript_22140:491-1174(+)